MIHPYDDPRLSKLLTFIVSKKGLSNSTAMDIVRELQRIEEKLAEPHKDPVRLARD